MYQQYVHSRSPQQNNRRVMTVTGNGEVAVEPNTATIELSVVTNNKQLAIAQQENSETMANVIEALIQLGIPSENIRTVSFNIYPRYDFSDGKQVFIGYEVVNTILVTITNFSQIGTVIDIAVRNGVNQIGNLTFSHSNHQKLEQQALQLALQNAHGKAEAMADSLHVQLQPVPVEIIEQPQESSVPFKAFSAAEQTQTPIQPGQIMITAIVRVKYEY